MAIDAFSPISLTSLAVAALSIGLASLVWWRRLVRIGEMRGTVQQIYSLSEEILDFDTQSAVRERVERGLSSLLPVDSVQILQTRPAHDTPGTVLLPMTLRGDVSGWLELQGLSLRLQSEEASALGHLANQIAIAEQLGAQRALQERLLQSERQGAVGQLISSIAAELKPPLQRLREARDPSRIEPETAEALSVLDRLISFARPDHGQRTVIDIGEMLRGLLDLRSEPMRLGLLRAESTIGDEPLSVLGARSALEQAFLNVLVFAEQSLAFAEPRVVSLVAGRDGPAVFVRIDVHAPTSDEAESLLAVSRGVIEAHHGSWRMAAGPDRTMIETRLPASAPSVPSSQARRPARQLTLLVLTPESESMRQLSQSLAACGHRVVPATGGIDALLLASRVSFDAILSIEALPDMEWKEFVERAAKTGAALLTLVPRGVPPPSGPLVLRIPADEFEIHAALSPFEALPPRDRVS